MFMFPVRQDFMVREDGALAQRLQEEECKKRADVILFCLNCADNEELLLVHAWWKSRMRR